MAWEDLSWNEISKASRNRFPSRVLLILTSLAGQPRHGYALLKDVENLSGYQVRLSTGTLYGAIQRLLRDGCIERFEQEDVSREKQAYRLTRAGRIRLQLEN